MQRICSECGKKITGKGCYYWFDLLGKRLKCKKCYLRLSGKTEKELKEMEE